MDDEALVGIAARGTVTLKSSGSKMSEKDRLMTIAGEEGLFPADRSALAGRWQHPLVKSIQTRRGKASRF